MGRNKNWKGEPSSVILAKMSSLDKKKEQLKFSGHKSYWVLVRFYKIFTLFKFYFQVELTVSPLPTLTESDKVLCTFGETTHDAQLKEGVIICDPPDIIPPTPKGQGKEILLPSTYNKRKEHSLLLLMWCSYMCCIQGFFPLPVPFPVWLNLVHSNSLKKKSFAQTFSIAVFTSCSIPSVSTRNLKQELGRGIDTEPERCYSVSQTNRTQLL